MATLFDVKTNDEHWIVYQITETTSELIDKLAAWSDSSCWKSDKILLDGFGSDARKKEWITVRWLLAKMLSEYPEIVYDSQGKPSLRNSSKHISISHSSGYVGVLLSEYTHAGLDIEVLGDRVERIVTKFMSPEDVAKFNKSTRKELLHLHWCAKEALTKVYGKKDLVFADEIRVELFDLIPSGLFSAKILKGNTPLSYKMSYRIEQGLVIVKTLK